MFEVTDEVLGSGGGGTGSYRKRPVSPLLLMNVRCQPGALEVKMCIPAMHRRRRKLWALGGAPEKRQELWERRGPRERKTRALAVGDPDQRFLAGVVCENVSQYLIRVRCLGL